MEAREASRAPPATVDLQLPASPKSVTDARHEAADYLERLGEPSWGIQLAVSEAVKNAVEHAFPGDRSGSVWLRIETLVPDTLVVSVTDDGVGITPDLDSDGLGSDGLGIGLSLIGRISHDFDIRNAEPHGTAVTMRFSLGDEALASKNSKD
jgi:anti-sigma regulatory factor (Ser/Thr protein kinase)